MTNQEAPGQPDFSLDTTKTPTAPPYRDPMTHTTLATLLSVIIWCTLGLAVLHWTNRAPIQYLRSIHTAPPKVQAIAEQQPALFVTVTVVQTICFLAVWPLFLVLKLRNLARSRGRRHVTERPQKPKEHRSPSHRAR